MTAAPDSSNELPKAKRKRLLQQPPEVVQRWMRMKMIKGAHRLARIYMRWRLPRSERARGRALEEAFNTIKDQAIKLEHARYKASSTIMNIALFFMLAERDVFILKIDALTHPDEWTRKLYARVILLTIHELDLDKVSGRQLREALETIGASEELRKEAYQALRDLRTVQNKARKEFNLLRNATIGHRDSDALFQYRAIRNLKTEHVFAIAGEFYAGAKRFIDLVPRLMLESGNLAALLRQYVQSDKDKK
jgi:hypothetical protein